MSNEQEDPVKIFFFSRGDCTIPVCIGNNSSPYVVGNFYKKEQMRGYHANLAFHINRRFGDGDFLFDSIEMPLWNIPHIEFLIKEAIKAEKFLHPVTIKGE